jgi:hypothetical protein
MQRGIWGSEKISLDKHSFSLNEEETGAAERILEAVKMGWTGLFKEEVARAEREGHNVYKLLHAREEGTRNTVFHLLAEKPGSEPGIAVELWKRGILLKESRNAAGLKPLQSAEAAGNTPFIATLIDLGADDRVLKNRNWKAPVVSQLQTLVQSFVKAGNDTQGGGAAIPTVAAAPVSSLP